MIEPMRETDGKRPIFRTIWIVYGLLGVLVVSYVALLALRGGQTWPWLDSWGVAAFEIVVSLLCLARAAVDRRRTAIPLLLGLGILSWSLGDLVLAVESVGGATPPVPSLADLFYLGFYPITYVALTLIMRRQAGRQNATSLLDGAVAGLGAAALCAAFVFQGVLRSAGGGAAAVATNLAYPVGDLLLLVMVVGATAILPARRRRRWALLATGYLVNAVGDTCALFGSGIGATHVGTIFNAIAWPVSILLISAFVWLPRRPVEPASTESVPGFVLPGLATAAAVAILMVGSLHRIDLPAVALAGATLLVAGVRFALSLMRLRKLTEQREVHALTDQLTAIGNRRALSELIDGLIAEHATGDVEARQLAFLFVDLNRFKQVNDAFGHAAGDDVLRELGQRLKQSLRNSDLVVRLGGDEFAVVLMDANADAATKVAGRIHSELEEPFLVGTVRARLTASIGIAVMTTDTTDTKELLRRADLAMYRSKLDGQPHAIYHEQLDGKSSRIILAEDLRLAIERRQLKLHYQPQVELSTGEVVSVEALVRWTHPHLGNVPPLEFLPLAEQADLMGALTELVLDSALAQCARWRANGQPVAVSVNISATNLLEPGFPESIAQALRTHGLPAESLVLEITETTVMADLDRCRRAIEELRDLGLVVSVDDFGAGFTSLAYLSSLAVGELKLDRSFINALASDDRDLALVQSTIELAHALGLRVVAEGVEDDGALGLLKELDCDLAQGYLISRPKPSDELALSRYQQMQVA
jgi:diguanylate cyclase